MALRLTREAERDLKDIYVRGALQFGTPQAERYSDALDACFELLAAPPLMAPARTEISKPVRAHPHGSHLVLYEIENDDALVLRIFHRCRDWQRAL